MPDYTTNLHLKKPLPEDPYNIADANDNMDLLDAAVHTGDAALSGHLQDAAPHNATATATASKIVVRDANGRAAFATPAAAGDAATKNYVDTADALKLNASGGEIRNYSETMVTNATAAGNVTLDVANGNVFNLTLSGAVTLAFPTGLATGKAFSFTLVINQGSTAYAITWPAALKWDSDSIPDLSAVGKTSILVFETFNGGTRWYGRLGMGNMTT